MQLLKFTFVTLLFTAGLSACGNPNQELIDSAPLISESYTDDLNRDLKLAKVPERIVSMAPNVTEVIYALGKEDHLVARSHVCDFPDDAYNKLEITTFPSLDLPSIVAQEPDLILASSEIHSEQIIASFEQLRLPLLYQSYNRLEDVWRNMNTIGAMLHAKEEAQRLTDSLARMVQTIADSTEGEIGYRTAILVGIDPITVVGKKCFMHEALEKCGGKNVFASLDESYPTVTAEQLVQAAPEYILLPSNNDQVYQELIAKYPDLHTKLPAALDNHVFLTRPDLIARPGPRIVEGMVELVRILHPRVDLTELL
ncbi:MAG: helical backbone metal receptor [Bacteroidota bacterium]